MSDKTGFYPKRKTLYMIIFNISLVVLIALFLAIPLTFLWNGVIPYITEFEKINYFQALALLMISRILLPTTWISLVGRKSRGGKKEDWKEAFFGRLEEFGKREKDNH